MATVQVKAQLRETGGKGEARQLRMSGRIPGIVYGAGEENMPISLDSAPFEQLLRHISGNAILDLQVQGRESSDLKVIIKEVQRNPVNSKVLHVDLEHISMSRKVRVSIPVHLTGVAIGVKEGGVLEHLLREIEVECMPTEIPERITLDVTHLDRGNSIHVREIGLGNFHILEPSDRVVVTVVGKTKEEEPVVVAAPAAEAAPVEAGKEKEKETGKDKDKDKDRDKDKDKK